MLNEHTLEPSWFEAYTEEEFLLAIDSREAVEYARLWIARVTIFFQAIIASTVLATAIEAVKL